MNVSFLHKISKFLEFSDIVRFGILVIAGMLVLFNGPALSNGLVKGPSSIDQPWIVSPAPNEEVAAGMVTFSGTGPSGQMVEVQENGRIVGEGWVKDGKWALTGKLFGPGKTFVFVKAIGGKSKQSPSVPLNVKGSTVKFLSITAPLDGDYLVPGHVTVKGQGKPADEVYVTYNGRVMGKATVDSDGHWELPMDLYQPSEQATIRATSQTLGEIALVVVAGTG